MKSNNAKFSLKSVFLGTIFLIPFSAPLKYAAEPSISLSRILKSPAFAEMQVAASEDLPNKTEHKVRSNGELSDGWKYVIAGLVMAFFLGLAIFVQLRAEREK